VYIVCFRQVRSFSYIISYLFTLQKNAFFILLILSRIQFFLGPSKLLHYVSFQFIDSIPDEGYCSNVVHTKLDNLCCYYNHWVDTCAGRLLIPGGYHSLGRVDTCAGKLLIPESIIHSVDTCAGRLLIPEGIQGRIQDFKLGEAHLKKLGRAKGGANIFGVFRVKNLDFTPKNPVPPRNHPLLIPEGIIHSVVGTDMVY
jgi:hypothetical protein